MRAVPAEAIGTRTFPALGTFASLLVTDRRSMELAFGLLAGELVAMDMACSRFRPDSELWRVNHASGHPVVKSFEPGEDWTWCYVDDVALMIDGIPHPHRLPYPGEA